MGLKLYGRSDYEGSCGKSVVNQQPCDAFNPFPSMFHPVCMADESGLGLVMLRSWETFLEVSTRPMQTPGVPAEHHSPAVSHSFCSKGTRIMLVTKVVFLVLSKCGADRSLCLHSPCTDVLQDLCTEIPSAMEEKGDVNTWTAAFGSQPLGTMVQRGLQGNRTFC